MTTTLTQCQSYGIKLDNNTNQPNTFGAPPYCMIAFPANGVPTTSRIGTDPNNLSWTVNQRQGEHYLTTICALYLLTLSSRLFADAFLNGFKWKPRRSASNSVYRDEFVIRASQSFTQVLNPLPSVRWQFRLSASSAHSQHQSIRKRIRNDRDL